jgi:hypothetical protein
MTREMLRWEIKNANLCYGTILALLKNLSRAFLARQTPKVLSSRC